MLRCEYNNVNHFRVYLLFYEYESCIGASFACLRAHLSVLRECGCEKCASKFPGGRVWDGTYGQ